MRLIKRIDIILVTVLVLVATLIRFHELGRLSFWYDELFTTGMLKPDLKFLFHLIWKSDINMILYDVIINIWYKWFPNPTESALRVPSAIFSVVSIPVVYLLAKITSPKKEMAIKAGIVAALLVTLNPFHIYFAQQLRSYSLLFLLSTLSTVLFIKAIKSKTSINSWLIYSLVSAAALYSHFIVALLLATHFFFIIYLIIEKKVLLKIKWVFLAYFSIFCLSAPIVYAAYVWGYYQIAWIPPLNSNQIFDVLIDLAGMRKEFLPLLYLLALPLSWLVLVHKFYDNHDFRWKFYLLQSCTLVPFFALLLFSIYRPMFLSRYLFFIIPYFTVIIAHGITYFIEKKNLLKNVLAGLVLFLFTWQSTLSIQNYFSSLYNEDYRSTAKFMSEMCSKKLILYYPEYIERFIPFYDEGLFSQMVGWQTLLEQNLTASEVSSNLPSDGDGACFMTGNLFNPVTEKQQIEISLTIEALKTRYPVKLYKNFTGGQTVYIFEKK